VRNRGIHAPVAKTFIPLVNDYLFCQSIIQYIIQLLHSLASSVKISE
jgi:hypothetical protein